MKNRSEKIKVQNNPEHCKPYCKKFEQKSDGRFYCIFCGGVKYTVLD